MGWLATSTPVRAQQHYHVPAGHKEALGFIVAPQNTNHNTITEHTPNEEFQMAQIGLSEQAPYQGGIASKGSHKV
jgi:hypothetical protein